MSLTRRDLEDRDAEDPLRAHRKRFALPEGTIYLDGNSLGPLPSHVPDVVGRTITEEWGTDLITSWNEHGWWDLARRVGDRLAPLLGVPPGSVVAGDSTTVALFKAAWAARRLRPDRDTILTDSGNFPTDLYALRAVADQAGADLMVVDPGEVPDRLGDDVAVVALTHVDYRTGRRHPMADITDAASESGAVMLWDLSHSAGAMDLDLSSSAMAVGCGYKYLNGGPGAPAFVYVHESLQGQFHNPISGWWGHAEPFAMDLDFQPAEGIGRVQVGTHPILSMVSLEAALELFDDVETPALRRKSELLTDAFIELADERLDDFTVVTPRRPHLRGSHVSLSHPEAPAIMAALIARGVIGDVRPPNLLRFGLAPLFQRHVEVWDAVDAIRTVMEGEEWKRVPDRTGPVT